MANQVIHTGKSPVSCKMQREILTFFFGLVLPLVTGHLLTRKSGFDGKSLDPLIDFTITGILPVLAFLSFWNVELDISLVSLPFIGLAMQLVPGGIAWLRTGSKPGNSLEKGSYILSNLLCNRGIIGGLTVFILLGEEGYAYSQLTIILGLPSLLAVGFPVARHFHARHHPSAVRSTSLRGCLFDKRQAALIGLVAGILLNYAGVRRPESAGAAFNALIMTAAWTMLVPVGASLNFREMKAYWRIVLDIIPIRFVISPLVIYVLGVLCGLEGVPLLTVVTLSFSPTAINAVVISKLYSLNEHLAGAAFFLTTIIYMAVIFPALLLII